MTPIPATGLPPAAPQVVTQQAMGSGMPAAAQFAMGKMGASQQDLQNFSSSQYALTAMDEVAQSLGKVVKVVAATRPDLMPILQKMAQMGSALTNELQNGQGGQGTGAPEPEGDEAAAAGGAPQEGASMTLGG